MKKVLHMVNPHLPKPQLHAHFQQEGWEEIRDQRGMVCLPKVLDQVLDGLWFAYLLAGLTPAETIPALKHCLRVLKDDGLLITVVGDAEIAARHIAEGRIDTPLPNAPEKQWASDILYGRNAELRQCFTALTLGQTFKKAGFSDIQITRDSTLLWVLATARPSKRSQLSSKIQIRDNHHPAGLPDAIEEEPQKL